MAMIELPPGATFNDLDRRAMNLCRRIMDNVTLYKGSAFLVGKERLTLNQHIDGLIQQHLNDPFIANYIADKNTPAYIVDFINNVTRKILRHDMAEIIREPQTFYQKSNAALPQPNIKMAEYDIVCTSYDLAQKFAACHRDDDFIDVMENLQNDLTDYDDIASQKTGRAYKDYVETIFYGIDQSLKNIQQNQRFPIILGNASLIADNNALHKLHYDETEDEILRLKSPDGMYTKLLDKNNDQYLNFGKRRRYDPSIGGLPLTCEDSDLFIKTIARGENPLPGFLNAVDNDVAESGQDLTAFKAHAYALVYDHILQYALLAKPIIVLDKDARIDEPRSGNAEHVFQEFCDAKLDMLVDRRRTVHPLADKYYLTNLEVAAKALTFHQKGDLRRTSLLADSTYDLDFVGAFERNLSSIKTNPDVYLNG